MKKRISLYLLFFLILAIDINASDKLFQSVKKSQAVFVKEGASKEFCSICGMHLSKFYKTNHISRFKDGESHQYCSLHCQAEVLINKKNQIKQIEVVDTNSLKLIDVKKAFYVVGSSKKGTMSPISKYAFSSKEKAEKFQKKFGGEIYDFDKALDIAKKGLAKDNMIINKKRVKMAKKGKKIYKKLCSKVEKNDFKTVGEAKDYLIKHKTCKNLKPKMLQAVSIYLYNPNLTKISNSKIAVKEDTKCPVCGMFVHKYPNWVAKISLKDGKEFFFDGVKDMMKFYKNPNKYNKKLDKNSIKNIRVTDYYTLKSLDARKSFYVVGSNIYGPMGEEFIPFETKKSAMKFKEDHFATKVLEFSEL